MKLDTAPITVATTALTIPAIAPWEAEKRGLYTFFRIKSNVKLVLSQSKPCEHSQKKNPTTEIITWNCSNQLFVFVNNEKWIL